MKNHLRRLFPLLAIFLFMSLTGEIVLSAAWRRVHLLIAPAAHCISKATQKN
jgi:cytochrome c-type biogenesis protein CcmE